MRTILFMLFAVFSINASSHEAEQAPELWSWFKDLDKSKEACEIQSSFTLSQLNLENQTENEHGIYGNIKSNKVVVKCIAIAERKSKLMVAVAGYNRDSVELIRNKVIRSIQ